MFLAVKKMLTKSSKIMVHILFKKKIDLNKVVLIFGLNTLFPLPRNLS